MDNKIDNKTSDLAALLRDAADFRNAIGPLSELYEGLSVDGAYAIQLENINHRLNSGERVSGKKIGLTSLAMQEMFNVNEPDYGHLMESMDSSANPIAIESLMQPRVEGEIAFVLKESLAGPCISADDVISATSYVVAALEIVDSRIKDWNIKLVDTIADNASSGKYVLGKTRLLLSNVDLVNEEMELYKNGELCNKGSGRDVLGNPANCVAWLANKLSGYGVSLNKGELVLSGALSAAVNAQKGDFFEAKFSSLGSVAAKFE
ncbi:MAG: 2-keto-4-pentenoate hydratase [Eubacteriaceae bacterium]|nr:2-keto-4-pentenoate hydratase [Eubacteriaceae bacterium]